MAHKFKVGDLVEICNAESAFKAHPNMLTGKLALVVSEPIKSSRLLIYHILVEGHTVSCMEEHLRDPAREQEIKMYDEYTD